MLKPGPVFTRPRTPAAKCLHLVRLNPIITRSELVEATGLSQPTITRATAALLQKGLVQERNDLTRSRGRGRPTVPLEVAENNWILAGIAVGTSQTHIGFYDTMGRTIREDDVPTPVAQLSEDDFIEHIMAGVNRLITGLDRKLVSVGVTTSGTVDNEGRITASNLGWENVDIAERLRFQFGVPVVVSSAIPAILGSETQAAELGNTDPVLVLFADDSIGAALSANDEVSQIIPLPATSKLADPEESLTTAAVLRKLGRTGTLAEAVAAAANNPAERKILDDRARQLGEIAALLVNEYKPATVVVAGSAFLDDPAAPKLFAAAVREKTGRGAQLRVIPSHKEIVRAITRAIALDPLLRVPLELF
ncbi:Crp/Fnr family transcriptional regulator [Corynebacterium striatum]|uniref:Crp/Fnr family transcriptional regulator n=1 Tax=Corynebacterium striatum TaxID=43770 RepID=A0A2Z2J0N8_CORST|nr:ROK family transcriptional regulator [Corynebacterium striatum]ART20154.1 Crp/Fnr family transcriptional regulator [Corynebacterium striatum]